MFIQRLTDNLKAQRQALCIEPTGHRHGRQARQRCRHGEDIVQIHGQRIGAFFPQAKGGTGCGRRQQQITAFPRPVKIAGDERAYLLRLSIIGIVKARREHIGANEDATLHLCPKACCAGGGVHVLQIGPIRQVAQAITHAIIAGEVGRSFGGRNDIISGQRIFGVRQRHIDNLGARIFQPIYALFPQSFNFGGHAIDAIFLWNADFLALQAGRQARFPLRHGQVERGCVLRVKARHIFEQDRAVADIARHGSCLIQRRGKGHHAPA